jgi:tetratricopeptide (TPR) repeat protein
MAASPSALAITLKNQGNDFFTAGQYEEALAKYLAAIKIDDSQVVFHSNAAQCLLNLNQPLQSLQYSLKATELDPKHVKSWVRQASALQALHGYNEALSLYETASKLDPTNTSIINEIQKCKLMAAESEKKVTVKSQVPELKQASQSSLPSTSKSKKLSALEEAKKALEVAPTEVPQAANSFAEFEAHWRTLLPSPEMLHRYLLTIEPIKLSSIFKDLMTADMLHSWLETVKILASASQSRAHAILLLENISKLQRFSLLKMFLSPAQNELVKSIFSALNLESNSSPSLESLQSKFLS